MSKEAGASAGVGRSVSGDIVNGLESLLRKAWETTQPLEVDPWRSQLFELFVTADGARLIRDDALTGVQEDNETFDETDLSADGLCRSLARRWGLDMAARESAASQSRLPPDQLEQMRLLWSLMRMWMEWSYAWRRWEEFHHD